MAFAPREMVPGIDFVYGALSPSETPLVVGLVGSVAYGLDVSDSDKDYLGVHYVDVTRLYGFGAVDLLKTSRVRGGPDFCSHEIHKFLTLALGCNPTVIELLFLDDYEYVSSDFLELIEMRSAFLSTKKVRNAYGGYVLGQAKRLKSRVDSGLEGFDPDLKKRTKKHARHCFRLLFQCEALLRTGEVVIDVSDIREEIFEAGEICVRDESAFFDLIVEKVRSLDSVESVLPLYADRDRIEDWLIEFRRNHA
jgi:predicted nucleotidyltransferase